MESRADAERAAWRRRMAALADFEEVGDGESGSRHEALAEAERWRANHGVPPLAEWWEAKSERMLHERARSLGLLRPVR